MADDKRRRDRDQLKPVTPPRGIQAQIAPPVGESWEDTTAIPTGQGPDDDTPVRGVPALDRPTPNDVAVQDAQANFRMRQRVKTTAAATEKIKEVTEATHTGIDTLRMETKKDVARLETKIGLVDSKVDKVDAKIDQHTGHVIRMVEAVGELKGQVTELVKSSDDKRERQMVTFEAHVEVDKAAKIATIDDTLKKRAWWRDVKLKVIGGVMGLLTSGAVIGHVVTHLRC